MRSGGVFMLGVGLLVISIVVAACLLLVTFASVDVQSALFGTAEPTVTATPTSTATATATATPTMTATLQPTAIATVTPTVQSVTNAEAVAVMKMGLAVFDITVEDIVILEASGIKTCVVYWIPTTTIEAEWWGQLGGIFGAIGSFAREDIRLDLAQVFYSKPDGTVVLITARAGDILDWQDERITSEEFVGRLVIEEYPNASAAPAASGSLS